MAFCPAFPTRRLSRATPSADVDADSKIRADLKKLSTLTRAVRLYSSTEGNELVPPIAAEFGIKVTVGAWIDKDKDRNKREIEAAINLARRNSNVIGVVVGNETIYRGEAVPLENLGARPPEIGLEPAECRADPRRGKPAGSGSRSAARRQAGRGAEMGDCGKQRLSSGQG